MNKATARGLAVGAAAALVAGVGVSYAAWTVTGVSAVPEGGNSKGYTSVPLTVTTDPIVAEAYPTLSAPQVVTVKNDNAFAVKLASLTTSVTSSDSSCNTHINGYYYAAAFTAPVNSTQLVRLAKGASAAINVPLTFTNDFPQSCEGKALSISFTATASSVA